jgi:RHS repeat-associated protein
LTLGKFKLSATGQTPFYGEYPLPGGSVLSQGGGATGVQVADWLGTIRAAYSYSGGSYEWSSAHAPFGETYVTTAGYTEGFAGEARGDGNPSNSIYWFPERTLRTSQGRWLSPDPAGMAAADPSNPQSWNRYVYVLNNPLIAIDPNGLD